MLAYTCGIVRFLSGRQTLLGDRDTGFIQTDGTLGIFLVSVLILCKAMREILLLQSCFHMCKIVYTHFLLYFTFCWIIIMRLDGFVA